jgi:starch synthase (maltosyl-transferring)
MIAIKTEHEHEHEHEHENIRMEQVRIVIESVTPQVDGGRFAVKAVVGDRLEVGADIWKDGHELLRAAVLWRRLEPALGRTPAVDLHQPGWNEVPMTTSYEANDRWLATIPLDEVGGYGFTVLAWTDVFASWREELRKKAEAGQDVASELLEGIAIVERTLERCRGKDRSELAALLSSLRSADGVRRVERALDQHLAELMQRNDPRSDVRVHPAVLPVWADRAQARFGAWYELFVRSQGTVVGRGATFAEAEKRLPEIAAMGFDVLYLAPIHPIGRTHRKGPNNAERCSPGDPGSPWAIGADEGGHTAVHPELGTLEDFDRFQAAARRCGMELALDFAVQCSPDHPWVKEHPAWFSKRPDGTIKYAENPPKKYQDIYPINFETEDRDGLYQALLDVVLFWVERGVKILRVDNPHTKPVSFWEWLIATVHRDHPDVLFLAEAFTRPKRMKMLAKAGFTQSYTYFTWRTRRRELEEYATELFRSDVRTYFRPNFFANTPDILHEILQKGGRPAFIMRLVLAATLSPTYGIYSGFELCENRALHEGSEEYIDSEKYQHKVWDWDRAGNIKDIVTRVNRIRRQHRALQLADDLVLLESSNQEIIAYAKLTPDGKDVLLIVVNLDPFRAQDGMVRVPADLPGTTEDRTFQVVDLLDGAAYSWRRGWNYVRLDPQVMPAHVLSVGAVGQESGAAATRG